MFNLKQPKASILNYVPMRQAESWLSIKATTVVDILRETGRFLTGIPSTNTTATEQVFGDLTTGPEPGHVEISSLGINNDLSLRFNGVAVAHATAICIEPSTLNITT